MTVLLHAKTPQVKIGMIRGAILECVKGPLRH